MRAVVRPKWRLLLLRTRTQQPGIVLARCRSPSVSAAWQSHVPRAPTSFRRQRGHCHAIATAVETFVQPIQQLVDQHIPTDAISAEDIVHRLRQNCMFDVEPGHEVLMLYHPPPPPPWTGPRSTPHTRCQRPHILTGSQAVLHGHGSHQGVDVAWTLRARADGAFHDQLTSKVWNSRLGYSGAEDVTCWEVRTSTRPVKR